LIGTNLIVLHVGKRNTEQISQNNFRLELLFYWVLTVDLKVLRTGTPVSRQLSDIRAVHVAYLQAIYGFFKFLSGSPIFFHKTVTKFISYTHEFFLLLIYN